MNSTKATSLLNRQLDKLTSLDEEKYQAWKTQTTSYIKDIFGSDSEELKFIKGFEFIGLYDNNPYNYQIKEKTPKIKTFLENCVESLEHRGFIKPKKDVVNKESWTKKYPVIWEIVKAIIILLVGYFFRVITEPRQNQVGNKINTEQTPNK